MTPPLRVTIWNENRQRSLEISAVYPEGIHAALAAPLAAQPDLAVCTALMDEPAFGLPDAVLDETDVLVWWAHIAHKELSDELTRKIQKRVLEGMGFIVLHSACWAKPFIALMGTTCQLSYRMGELEREYLWLVNPGHPIAAGIEYGFVIPEEEVYLEYFDIPQPDELVFISSFSGGEAFRSGCCFKRGAGKIFYFRPGHETCPTYHHAQVQRVLLNAVRWAAPTGKLAFEATHRGRDFLLDARNPAGPRVVGESHALAEILDPEKYVR